MMRIALENMELLDPGRFDGYPAEFLASRLRGRRAGLISDWAGLIFGSEPALPGEYGRHEKGRRPEEVAYNVLRTRMRWLYMQMPRQMRIDFGPLFLMHEAHAIFSALRLKEASAPPESVSAILKRSLLSGALKAALMDERVGTDEAFAVIASALRRMSGIKPEEAGLVRRKSGKPRSLKEHEAAFNEALMQWAASSARPPELRTYFAYLVDMTNVLTAYKHHRWGGAPEGGPDGRMMSCGEIPARRLRKISPDELRASAFRLARAADDGAKSMEAAMLRGLKLKMARLAREGSEHAALLSYVASASIEARDLCLVLSVRERMDEERMRAEMAS